MYDTRSNVNNSPRQGGSPNRSNEATHKLKQMRRNLQKRVNGKPTKSSSMPTITQVFTHTVWTTIKFVVVGLIIAGIILAGFGFGVFSGYIASATPLQLRNLQTNNTASVIYDVHGKEMLTLSGTGNEQREYVEYKTIKDTYMAKAVIAVEDERFRSHNGIDIKRIGAAIFSAIKSGGTPQHGGSTIDQQVVKMISGADEISAQRKIQEWYNAVELEKRLSKDEILGLYLNLMPMSNNYIGVQAAAKAYFGKEAKDLNLTECAFLAGIPNQPAIYNPLTETGKRNALRRMRITLGLMLSQKLITQEEYDAALNTELYLRIPEFTAGAVRINSYYTDYLLDQVLTDLEQKRGFSRSLAIITLYNGGLQIYSGEDPAQQAAVQKAFENESIFVQDADSLPDTPEHPQAGLAVISNEDGQVGRLVALGGGYGPKTGNYIFDRATMAKRQPGSSIKPILVYAPAIDAGRLTAATVLKDERKFLDPARPTVAWPRNASGGYMGDVTVRQALMYSLNTIAVEIYKNYVTPAIGMNYLKQLGIDRTSEQHLATSIGGLDNGMTPLEMAGAYGALANGGQYVKPWCYSKVMANDGSVLLHNVPETRQVFKPETAAIMTSIMNEATTSVGWFSHMNLPNQPAAGKTGTTDETRDSWFCGYTPYFTGACWYGYDNRNGRGTNIPEIDHFNSQRIWREAMKGLHANLERKNFSMPSSVMRLSVSRKSGLLAGPGSGDAYTEYFVPGSPANPTNYDNTTPSPTPGEPLPSMPVTIRPPLATPTPVPETTPKPTKPTTPKPTAVPHPTKP